MMRVARHDDVDRFASEVDALLRAEEPLHSHLWATIARLRSSVLPPIQDPYLAVVRDEDASAVGCGARVQGRPLSLSRFRDPAGVALLLRDALARRPDITRVLAPAEEARAVRQARRAAGGDTRRFMAQRSFSCARVIRPPPVPGRLRAASYDDLPLLERWMAAFMAEALQEHDVEAAAGIVAASLAHDPDRGLVVWEDEEPVSMAGFTGPTPTGITVLSVYTPPDLRGRGYAGACVAALTQQLLDGGRQQVFLSTDLSNPTSNRIYTAIGYLPVGDAEVLELT
jgi:uncharacterized protein